MYKHMTKLKEGQNFFDILNKQEELDKELEPYLELDHEWFPMLRHPLVFGVPYAEQWNALYNQQLAGKKQALAAARSEGDHESIIWLHERPYRLQALQALETTLGAPGGPAWVTLSRAVWVDTENLWQHRDAWHAILSELYAARGSHVWSTLPLLTGKTVTVYRGASSIEVDIYNDAQLGFSWTKNKKLAKWFAKRLPHRTEDSDYGPVLFTGKIAYEDIIGWIDDRGEQEIVLLPGFLQDLTMEELK